MSDSLRESRSRPWLTTPVSTKRTSLATSLRFSRVTLQAVNGEEVVRAYHGDSGGGSAQWPGLHSVMQQARRAGHMLVLATSRTLHARPRDVRISAHEERRVAETVRTLTQCIARASLERAPSSPQSTARRARRPRACFADKLLASVKECRTTQSIRLPSATCHSVPSGVEFRHMPTRTAGTGSTYVL